ncbi:MAG: hypothetical protein AAF921_16840 [Cyanobacteria bacterium P01_D01_bin.44]
MPSKNELQTILKEQYGINKNISQPLATEDCEQIVATLQGQPSLVKLVDSFALKNADLGRNNRHFGQLRSQAEKKLSAVKAEYHQLENQIATLEHAKQTLTERRQTLETDIKQLTAQNQHLDSTVQGLTTQNDELIEANTQLKKDNKDLKNAVDQIRLRLARDTKMLLQYEDSEIRKALIRLFRWTLG